MTTSNEVIARADLTIADLDTNGGLLQPEQSKQFIDMVMDQPTMLPQAQVIRMGAPEVKVNRMWFGSRILKAARTTGSELDGGGNDRYLRAADRSKVTTDQLTLTSSEVNAEIRINYETLEDNIEGQSLEGHIMRLIATKTAEDLEEFALWADTASSDPYLALQNGWLKRSVSHVADNLSAGVSPDLFVNGLLALPQKYHTRLGAMRGFISQANLIRYRQKVSQRMTGYGDAAMQGAIPLYAQGLQLEGAPMLANDGIGATGLITFPKNLIFGIRRDISVETDKDIRSREYIIVVTMRVGLQLELEDAVVKLENI